jgi:hypothetical protein
MVNPHLTRDKRCAKSIHWISFDTGFGWSVKLHPGMNPEYVEKGKTGIELLGRA